MLIYNLAGSQTYGSSIGGFGSLIKAGSNGTLVLEGTNTYSGPTSITGGTLQLGNGNTGYDGSLVSPNIALSNSAALVYDLNGSQTYGGVISGTGNLTKVGTGTLTLSGTNNLAYTGTTTVSGGVLEVTNTAAPPGYSGTATLTVKSGGTLALSVGGTGGWTTTSASSLLTKSGTGFAAGSALGMDTTGGNFSYPNVISGSMGLTKLGPNTLTLSNVSNAYSGTTTVNAGILEVTNTGALPGYNSTSRVQVNNGGTLALSVSGAGWTAIWTPARCSPTTSMALSQGRPSGLTQGAVTSCTPTPYLAAWAWQCWARIP